MAEIVIGAGTSHGPLLNTPPQEWGQRASADRANKALVYKGAEYTYDALLAQRAPGFARECELDVRVARHGAARAHIAELGDRIAAADADVLVVVSSDHKEVFGDELLPPFAIYWGEEMRHEPFTQEQLEGMKPGLAIAEVANVPEVSTVRTGHRRLARHLIAGIADRGFDVAASQRLPPGEWENSGIPHGWGFVFQQILDGHPIPPVIPVFVNTFWDPNPPSASRCFDFGRALGEAIRTFPEDLRVGIVASGGLSHFVVDEELDRAFIKALGDRDETHLRSVEASVMRSGTSELRNWIVGAAALHNGDLTARLIGYEPCYRTEAGTGCAMGFVVWTGEAR